MTLGIMLISTIVYSQLFENPFGKPEAVSSLGVQLNFQPEKLSKDCLDSADAFTACVFSSNTDTMAATCSKCNTQYGTLKTKCASEISKNYVTDITCDTYNSKNCIDETFIKIGDFALKPFSCANTCHKKYINFYRPIFGTSYFESAGWKRDDIKACLGEDCLSKSEDYLECFRKKNITEGDVVCSSCESVKPSCDCFPKSLYDQTDAQIYTLIGAQLNIQNLCNKIDGKYCISQIIESSGNTTNFSCDNKCTRNLSCGDPSRHKY